MSKKLALGTVQFGMDYGITNTEGKVSLIGVKDILATARKHAICTLDTAISYGDSQKVLGEADVSNFKIVSKLPPLNEFNLYSVAEGIEDYVMKTLSDLNLDSLYGLLLHDELDVKSNFAPTIFTKLKELQSRGIVEKFGVSFYDFEIMLETIEQFNIQLVQVPFNIFDQRLVANKYNEILLENNIEVHCRSLFLQGALLNQETPSSLIHYEEEFDAFKAFCLKSGLSQLQACLKIGLQSTAVSRMVIGVTTKEELDEIVEAIDTLGENSIDFSTLHTEDKVLINPALWRK